VSRELPIWARYSITALLVALAAQVQLAGDFGRYPFLLFFPVIILSGVVFNRGTSFFATLLSAAISAYYFLPPQRSLGIEQAHDVVALALFIAIGIATAILIEALHRAYVEIAEAHERLNKTASDRACATRSASQNPGGGSRQSSKVRTGTSRRTADEKPARRRRPPRAAMRTSLSIRSIVAALTASMRPRSASPRSNRPWRSKAGSRTGIIAFRRLPHTRSDASHKAISASRMASQ
jgi:hypothetical protein